MICSSLNRLLRITSPSWLCGTSHPKSEKSHFRWANFRGARQEREIEGLMNMTIDDFTPVYDAWRNHR